MEAPRAAVVGTGFGCRVGTARSGSTAADGARANV